MRVLVLLFVALTGCGLVGGSETPRGVHPDRRTNAWVAERTPDPPPEPVATAPAPAVRPTPAPAPRPSPAPAPAATTPGQIQLDTGAAVMVRVDGEPMIYDESSGSFLVNSITPGNHHVEVINLVGTITAEAVYTVNSGQRLRLRYRPKELELVGNVPATFHAAPAPDAPTSALEAIAQAMQGSVQITGVPSQGGVWIDGRRMSYSNTHGGYVLSDLSAGNHSLRVEAWGATAWEGAVEVRAQENTRCLLENLVFSWNLDCHYTTPVLH